MAIRLAPGRDHQVIAVEARELPPTRPGSSSRRAPRGGGRQLQAGAVVEREVADLELELLVLPEGQLGGGLRLHLERDGQLRDLALTPQLKRARAADLVLADLAGQDLRVLGPALGDRAAVEAQQDVADLKPRLLGLGSRVDPRDPAPPRPPS